MFSAIAIGYPFLGFMRQVALFGKLIILLKLHFNVTLLSLNNNLKRKENVSVEMNDFILLTSMQGYEIKSNSLKTRFIMAAFSLK